jgi:hypothetical protein
MPLTVAAAFAGIYKRRNRAMTLRSTHPNPVEKRVIDASSLIAAGSDLFVVRVEIYQRCLIPETRNSDLKDTWVGATMAILPRKARHTIDPVR